MDMDNQVQQEQGVKIRVMSGVSSAVVADRNLLRALGLFYVLKSMYKTGFIRDIHDQASEIAAAACMHEKTFWARLKILADRGLIRYTQKFIGSYLQVSVHLISGSELHEMLGVRSNPKYHYRRVRTRPDYILRALHIEENYQAQQRAITRKIIKQKQRGLGHRLPPETAAAIESEYARMRHLFIMRHKPVNFLDDDFFFNPDIAFSQLKYSDMLALKSPRMGHYWQHRLQKLGLIRIEQRRTDSKAGCGASPLGYKHYNRQEGETFIVQRNKIHFT